MTDIAEVLGIRFLPYKWRGKTYKTVSGLCSAVIKIHADCGVSFEKNAIHVRNRRTGEEYIYAVARTDVSSIVADKPMEGGQ